ncbi:MAG: T9SS type A sorting domain-containing protein, partial [Candidatus Neomarinimicrobiota bacterium]|nr:T9SS type A sorting domain-containing protein [Candidatus Neomarinimicrobiota bacterium]
SIDFTSVSLADLDLDNSVDIVAIDKIGNIHAFDENLVYKNGFPIKASAISSVLIADLFGNRHPEIVFEQKDGSIIITNYEGGFLESLSLNADTKLSSIGIYNSKNTIILNNQLLMYKDWNGEQYNRWIYKNSSPDFSRYLSIDTLKNTANNIQLLNNELTYAYPNPSYGEKITFRLQISSIQLIKISIYDLAGFLQESISIPVQNNLSDSSESTIEIPWDTKGIESGIYLAKIHVSNGNNSAEKILKLGVIK